MTSSSVADRILRLIGQRGYTPRSATELAGLMRLSDDERGEFHDACKALMKTGRVVMGSRNALMLPEPPGKIVGTFRANPRGFGFVIPETPYAHGDLFIPEGRSLNAVTGDTVRARVRKRGRREGRMIYEGEIIEIVTRGRRQFVGEIKNEFGQWFVVPDGRILHAPVFIGDASARQARRGDQVVVEITEYPVGERKARGVIVKVLGKRGEPEVDLESIRVQYDLPAEFSEDVLDDARQVIAEYDEAAERKRREVLADATIITIDPPDARDFDDAISLTRNRDGTIELGVHIADVAHFVRDGSPLDVEARQRASSIYFPRHVIPMLPEVLSNGLCSLQEKQWRLTKSAFITYDDAGRPIRSRFANTMIRSAKRLTYQQAQAILDGKAARTPKPIVELLGQMDQLAKTIRQRRLRDGMIVLDLSEIELKYDDDGRLVDVVPADASFTHTIIEMFMVEANEAVCRALTDAKIPHLRRIHDEPSFSAIESLSKFIRVLGQSLPRHPQRGDLQQLLDGVRGTTLTFPIHFAVLRSMQQAEYSPQLIGHFALASRHYAHFTSPIRRYPDLTIHRLLNLHVSGELRRAKATANVPDTAALIELGSHCSTRERHAEAAERELRLVKILRLLEKLVGDELPGIVTGVTQFGLYLQVDKYLVDGVLRLESIGDDWWDVDTKSGCIVGQRSGVRITIGDRLATIIQRVDLPQRQLELALPLNRLKKTAAPANGAQAPRSADKRAAGGKTQSSGGGTKRGRHRKGGGRRGKQG